MPASEASGEDAAARREGCMRLTTRRVPQNPSMKERTGLPFAVAVQPFAPLPASPDAGDVRMESADVVARCGECFGYVNGFCGFERDGWVCVLCGAFSYWNVKGAAKLPDGTPRYRRNPDRHALPELARAEYELEVAREILTVDPRDPLGSAPACVALVDVTAPEETLELVRAALVAALEAVGPHALFGVVTFSDRVSLHDVAGPAPAVRHVPISSRGHVAIPLEDALPIRRLLAPVGRRKDAIVAAVESIASVSSSSGLSAAGAGAATVGGDAEVVARVGGEDEKHASNHTSARAFGPALEAVLTWLGAASPGAESDDATRGTNPRRRFHPSCRVLAFLGGAPNLGDGAVDDAQGTSARGTSALGAVYGADADAAAAAADATCLPATCFYADAGDRAALASIAVDVFAVGGEATHDLASVAPLAERCGGALYRYDDGTSGFETSAAPIPRDVYRLLSRVDARDCTARLRASAEFAPPRALGNALIPDDTYEGLYHVVRCAEEDCFVFDLEHATRTGFGERGDCPPTLQLAFEYTVVEPLPPDEDEDEDEDATLEGRETGGLDSRPGRDSSRDSPHPTPGRYLRRRVRRVCTHQARVASSPRDAYASADADVVMLAVRRKIADVARDESLAEARLLLSDWLVILVSRFHHETGLARFDPDDVAVVDASFKTCPALASVPRATHAALSSTPLRVAGVHPDARVAANHRHARAHPEALRRATYPTVRAYANVYAETFEEIRASRRAMTASGGAVFVADGEHRVAVFYAPAEPGTAAAAVPFPPPRDSPVRAAVDAAREERTVTPRVAFVRGGAENPRAFDEMLAEERDVEGVDGGGGLAGFVAEVERRARAFMRESDA